MYCTHYLVHVSLLKVLLITPFVIGGVHLAGCGGSQPDLDTDIEETEAIYFDYIGQGASSTFADTTQIVIKDQEMWDSYQQYMETVLPFREIDFSQLMVVLVAVPVPIRGVAIQIQSVELVQGELVVNYAMGYPGDDCRGNDQPSTPFQAVVLRQIDASAQFERTVEKLPCTL